MAILLGLVKLILALSSIFLILIVMVQRGKGGGLAGALGGMGGQSALGTKAGDLFTRITIGVAAVWIITSMIAIKLFATGNNPLSGAIEAQPAPPATSTAPAVSGTAPAAPSTPAPSSLPTPEKPADTPAK